MPTLFFLVPALHHFPAFQDPSVASAGHNRPAPLSAEAPRGEDEEEEPPPQRASWMPTAIPKSATDGKPLPNDFLQMRAANCIGVG